MGPEGAKKAVFVSFVVPKKAPGFCCLKNIVATFCEGPFVKHTVVLIEGLADVAFTKKQPDLKLRDFSAFALTCHCG